MTIEAHKGFARKTEHTLPKYWWATVSVLKMWSPSCVNRSYENQKSVPLMTKPAVWFYSGYSCTFLSFQDLNSFESLATQQRTATAHRNMEIRDFCYVQAEELHKPMMQHFLNAVELMTKFAISINAPCNLVFILFHDLGILVNQTTHQCTVTCARPFRGDCDGRNEKTSWILLTKMTSICLPN